MRGCHFQIYTRRCNGGAVACNKPLWLLSSISIEPEWRELVLRFCAEVQKDIRQGRRQFVKLAAENSSFLTMLIDVEGPITLQKTAN